MSNNKALTVVVLGVLLITTIAVVFVGQAAPDHVPLLAAVGTGFTYQGTLEDGAGPANGSYDLRFSLWDDPTGGSPVGTPQTKSGLSVISGRFTVVLDFGEVFDGTARYLAIEVKGPGDPDYTLLSPRQAITPAPYALNADWLDGLDSSAFSPSSGVPKSCQWRVVKEAGDEVTIAECSTVGLDYYALSGGCYSNGDPLETCFPTQGGLRYGNGASTQTYPESQRADGWYGRWTGTGTHEVAVQCCQW